MKELGDDINLVFPVIVDVIFIILVGEFVRYT
jgi:hypothetical protein